MAFQLEGSPDLQRPGALPFDGLPEGEITADSYGMLATELNAEVGAVHPEAMPAILTGGVRAGDPPWAEAKALQRPAA